MLTKHHLTKVSNNILIIGKTGAGKSYLAKWIHNNSERKNKPYYQINIGSMSDQIFESEIFGHSKGSFTGANNDKKGFCEMTLDGTLFIDEIGEMNLEQQKKLLTLIEERIYYSVGSSIKKDFKGVFIFATNKDLEIEVKEGRFREDLYFRIRAYTFEVEELTKNLNKAEIIKKEISKVKEKYGKENIEIAQGVIAFLNHYSFPGNYRELKQIVDYMIFMAEESVKLENLPIWINKKSVKKSNSDNYYEALIDFEKEFLFEKLKKFQGRINFTSEKINLSKVTLISKIKKYDINIQQLKFNTMITA